MTMLLGGAIAAAAVFAVAGTLQWWNAWVFLIFVVALGWSSANAIGRSPGLAEERRTASSKAERWDRSVVLLINLSLPVMSLLAAIDRRFKWLSAVPVAVSLASFAGMAVAAAITYRAMVVNPFFSSYVRIQEDRGHTVVVTGPYRIVRHPGYAGAVIFNLLVPLALGSWIAAPVGVGAVLLLVFRTAKEDGILFAELPGYAEYARRVPRRLVPWVW
jgi:protein-S-isoprenylcysteine O-methyltransferase Ste14